MGEAKAAAEAATWPRTAGLSQGALLALGLQELAGKLPQIGSLVLSPDLLAPVLAKLGAAEAAPAGGAGTGRS